METIERIKAIGASEGAGAGEALGWGLGVKEQDQLAFWREAEPISMARALYALCVDPRLGQEIESALQWRLMGFLRRHCEALCALRERSGVSVNAARVRESLSFDRVLDLCERGPEPAAAGLRKYVSEINGSRPALASAGRSQAARSHNETTSALTQTLGELSCYESAAVAAGRSALPGSMSELRSWLEAAEVERWCAAPAAASDWVQLGL